MRSLVGAGHVPICRACETSAPGPSNRGHRLMMIWGNLGQHGPDISRSRQRLSWAPSVPFEDGLEHAFEDFAKQTNTPLLPALRRRSHTRARQRSKPAKSYFTGQGSRRP
jgi:hypothetical protein